MPFIKYHLFGQESKSLERPFSKNGNIRIHLEVIQNITRTFWNGSGAVVLKSRGKDPPYTFMLLH